jgi:hypothetical protein
LETIFTNGAGIALKALRSVTSDRIFHAIIFDLSKLCNIAARKAEKTNYQTLL